MLALQDYEMIALLHMASSFIIRLYRSHLSPFAASKRQLGIKYLSSFAKYRIIK